MPYLIYVLHCTGDTLYTGITPDLRRRMQVWSTETRTAAARFEYAFKQLPRSQKLLLLESPEQWQTVLPELAEETYLPAEHLPLQSYLSRS